MNHEDFKFHHFSPYDTPEVNKKKYRSLSIKYHPDKTRGNKHAEELFKEISVEYAKLEKFQKEYGVLINGESIFTPKFNINVKRAEWNNDPLEDKLKRYFTADQKIKEKELEKLGNNIVDALYKILTGRKPPRRR